MQDTTVVSSRPKRQAGRQVARGLIIPVTLVLMWQASASLDLIPTMVLPGPVTVVNAWWIWIFGVKSSLAWYSGTWVQFIGMSTSRVLLGFGVGAIAGIVVGMLTGWFRLATDLLDPFLQWIRPIPITAWLPFTTLIFGIREGAAVSLIALGTFFPVMVNTASGVRLTPSVLVRAARMLGASPRRVLVRVVAPAAMPSIITGCRVGMGLAWVLVIVAEMLAVKGGLGYALWAAYSFGRMDLIICAMVTVGFMGLMFDYVLVLGTRPLVRWTEGI